MIGDNTQQELPDATKVFLVVLVIFVGGLFLISNTIGLIQTLPRAALTVTNQSTDRVVRMDRSGKLVVTADNVSYWLRLVQDEKGTWRPTLEPVRE